MLDPNSGGRASAAAGVPHFAVWVAYSTCKQPFAGQAKLRLAIALWTKHARTVETNQGRLAVTGAYASAPKGAGEHADTTQLERGLLYALTQKLGSENCDKLVCASDGSNADAARRMRGGGGAPADDARHTDSHARAG